MVSVNLSGPSSEPLNSSLCLLCRRGCCKCHWCILYLGHARETNPARVSPLILNLVSKSKSLNLISKSKSLNLISKSKSLNLISKSKSLNLISKSKSLNLVFQSLLQTKIYGCISYNTCGTYISSGLCSINLHIRPGQLVGIVGQVGAGKSSLLSCLLGEMEKACGSVKIRVSDYKQYKELVDLSVLLNCERVRWRMCLSKPGYRTTQ